MAKWIVLIIFTSVLAGCPPPTSDGLPDVLVNDFNSGDGKNAQGFCMQTFSDTSGRPRVKVDFGGPNRAGRNGRSLQLDFDVSDSGVPFGGYVEMLIGVGGNCGPIGQPFNGKGMSELQFWVKRSLADVDMEIALKDVHGVQTTPKRLLTAYAGRDTNWTQVRILLSDLVSAQGGQQVDLSALREINFSFAKERFLAVHGALKGTVYLDDVGFNE